MKRSIRHISIIAAALLALSASCRASRKEQVKTHAAVRTEIAEAVQSRAESLTQAAAVESAVTALCIDSISAYMEADSIKAPSGAVIYRPRIGRKASGVKRQERSSALDSRITWQVDTAATALMQKAQGESEAAAKSENKVGGGWIAALEAVLGLAALAWAVRLVYDYRKKHMR